MKQWLAPVALVLVIALGSYAIFAQQPSSMPQGGNDGMMGGGMNAGMMDNMACSGCGAMMQAAVSATSDGGVVVAAGGKLMKYDAALKKVSEADIDIDWNAVHQKMQQSCPMMQQMMKP